MVNIYAATIPKRIFLEVPSGALWTGIYVPGTNRIEGLLSMFNYYDLKPYFMFVLRYNGGKKLHVEIFNPYGVEVDYPMQVAQTSAKSMMSAGSIKFENEKLCAQFSFNCYNTGNGDYDLLVCKDHLKKKKFTQVNTFVIIYSQIELLIRSDKN